MKKENFLVIIATLLIMILVLIGGKIIIDKCTKSDFVLDSENKYQITTSMKWDTMESDGGSHTSLYYQIDLDENKMLECIDRYVGFKGYKYKGKILRSKNLSEEDKRELRIILGSMLYPENLSESERQELKLMLDKVKNDKESHSYNILSTVNREDVKFSDSRIIEVLEKMLQG